MSAFHEGPADPPAWEATERARLLEAAYGPVIRLGGGRHSRVYLAPGAGGDAAVRAGLVLKVYREPGGMNRLEAEHMVRAGLGEWVVGPTELGGLDLLVMRRFPGRPLTAEDIGAALPALGAFLRGLHDRRAGSAVDLGAVRAKLEQFAPALPDPTLGPLFRAVRAALDGGRLEAEARLCHLDLWCANILLGPEGRVLVVDWARSGWDDPARDLAILKTGTLDQLSPAAALEATRAVVGDDRGVAGRLPAYVALQTLHDLYWFLQHEPAGYREASAFKVPRALAML